MTHNEEDVQRSVQLNVERAAAMQRFQLRKWAHVRFFAFKISNVHFTKKNIFLGTATEAIKSPAQFFKDMRHK